MAKSFEEYMESQIKNYKDYFDAESLEKLRKIYDEKEAEYATAKNQFDAGLDPKSIVDHTNDYEKAMKRANQAQQSLNNEIGFIEFMLAQVGEDYKEKISKESLGEMKDLFVGWQDALKEKDEKETEANNYSKALSALLQGLKNKINGNSNEMHM